MRISAESPAIFRATIVMFSFAFSGCVNSSQLVAGTLSQNVQPVKSTAEKLGQPPSEEECLKFARRVEKAALEGDLAAFDAAIDYDAILKSATGGIPGVEDARNKFIAGSKDSLLGGMGLAAVICEQVKAGGSFVFLRTVDIENQKRIRFRLLPPGAGVNYHEWIVVRDPSGQVKAVDIYTYLSAELLSQTIRRSFLPLAARENRSVQSKMAGSDREFVKNHPKMLEMLGLYRRYEFDKAELIYNDMPPSIKQDKSILLFRFNLAMNSRDDERYRNVMEDFRRFHPKDTCVDFISIDYHAMKQEYDQAIECVKKIEKAIGKDSYLVFLQGRIYLKKGDLKVAQRLLQDSIKAEPTLEQPYRSLVEVSLKEKDFDETNRLLDQLEEKFKVKSTDFVKIPEYKDYLKSPQYKERCKKQNIVVLPGLDDN